MQYCLQQGTHTNNKNLQCLKALSATSVPRCFIALSPEAFISVHIRGGRYAKHGKPANFDAVEAPDDVYFVEVSAKGN